MPEADKNDRNEDEDDIISLVELVRKLFSKKSKTRIYPAVNETFLSPKCCLRLLRKLQSYTWKSNTTGVFF